MPGTQRVRNSKCAGTSRAQPRRLDAIVRCPGSQRRTAAEDDTLGDRLGLFKAIAGAGPVTVEELTRKTGLHARYVRAWLETMVAAEYIEYQPGDKTFLLPPEHAAVVADEESPLFMGGALEFLVPAVIVTPKVQDAFFFEMRI